MGREPMQCYPTAGDAMTAPIDVLHNKHLSRGCLSETSARLGSSHAPTRFSLRIKYIYTSALASLLTDSPYHFQSGTSQPGSSLDLQPRNRSSLPLSFIFR